MKIECKCKREGGSVIDIDGIQYEFKPGADGAHVAEVTKTEHIERFLAIPEGYKIHGKAEAKPKKVAEKTVPVTDEGNEDGDEGEENEGNEEGAGDEPELDLDALRQAYTEQFGKAPHPSMKAESILAKLEAA